jgi:hypothetical protein
MPDETCRCEVLDPTTEGGGTDPRSCPEHAYEAGRRHERSVYLEEREKAREVYATQLHRLQDECAALATGLDDNRVLSQHMAKWILDYHPRNPTDHACSRCIPGGEIIVSGFVCAWHVAEGLRAAVAVAAAKSGAKKSERCSGGD